MLEYVADRDEEILLIHFVLREARANKELIASLEDPDNFEVEIKPNGVIHKTKENHRLSLIRQLKKENAGYKKFFKARNIEGEFTTSRFKFKKRISDGRHHLREYT